MKFDKVIMNPPYDGNLHLKILEQVLSAYGIEEKYITGDGDSYTKFLKWAETVENLIGNPLYHWTHLELQRYFGIYTPLTVKSAPQIWDKANALLQTQSLSVDGIFKKFKVYAVRSEEHTSALQSPDHL